MSLVMKVLLFLGFMLFMLEGSSFSIEELSSTPIPIKRSRSNLKEVHNYVVIAPVGYGIPSRSNNLPGLYQGDLMGFYSDIMNRNFLFGFNLGYAYGAGDMSPNKISRSAPSTIDNTKIISGDAWVGTFYRQNMTFTARPSLRISLGSRPNHGIFFRFDAGASVVRLKTQESSYDTIEYANVNPNQLIVKTSEKTNLNTKTSFSWCLGAGYSFPFGDQASWVTQVLYNDYAVGSQEGDSKSLGMNVGMLF